MRLRQTHPFTGTTLVRGQGRGGSSGEVFGHTSGL